MFTYKSNGQPDTFGFLPAGVYPAVVTKVEEKMSKSGNPMLVVSLKALNRSGESTTVQQYLPATEKSIWKIDSFMWAIGICPEAGQTVTVMPNQVVGKKCYVRIGVEQGDTRDFNNCQEVMSEEEGRILSEQKPLPVKHMSAEDKSGPGWKGNSYYPEEVSKSKKPMQQGEIEALDNDDDIPF